MSYSLYDSESAESLEKQLLRRKCLTPADRKLITALLDRNTQAEIALDMGCSRQTVATRLKLLRTKLLANGYGNDWGMKDKKDSGLQGIVGDGDAQ